MAFTFVGEGEKSYISEGVNVNYRSDGRTCYEYRPIELETGILTNCAGSARVRIGNSDVLVGIKTEIDVPDPATPDRGKIDFFVDCSVSATSESNDKRGVNLSFELCNTLKKVYGAPDVFNYKSLCIIPGQLCYKVHIDILVLECGGNLFNVVSITVKAALLKMKITKPEAVKIMLDGQMIEMSMVDFLNDINYIPIVISICTFQHIFIIDPSAEEEESCNTSLIIGICNKRGKTLITYLSTSGQGYMKMSTLKDAITAAASISENLDANLHEALKYEDKFENKFGKKIIYGFSH